AAKLGRPVLNQALKLLRNGKAQGIILHKLDRGARNLRDWAAIGELSDQGIEVHFVTESIDPVMVPLVRRALELYERLNTTSNLWARSYTGSVCGAKAAAK